ncbi:MAG: aldehyde dehydrogenase family protein [Armatimonadota bacterium]|nr:aldehyde dehydrogenase family protein [Armatimonadota bacterium]MDR5697496.1 aldehyde dehydrogenase family protein [Armatimonadota bacterium]
MRTATERTYHPLHIGGAEVDTPQRYEVTNPSTNEVMAEVALATAEEVDRAAGAARAAFEGEWARTAPAKRGQILARVASLIRERGADLARTETLNVGKAIASAQAEVEVAAATFEFFAGAANKIYGETLGGPFPGSFAYTVREPVGVVGAIVPWNYPLMLAAWKIAPALAAGNTVVLKPSPLTPLTALALARLCTEAGLPAGAVNVVTGDVEIGRALVEHPGVDKVTFTGSTANGARVMAAAAGTIKRVSLELGGKSPNIVFADADLEAAAAGSVWAAYYSAGQSCEARTRLLVAAPVYDDFLAMLVEKTRRVVVGDPLDPKTMMGSLISRAHLERVHGYVEAARAEGAEVVVGGSRATEGWLERGNFYLPTVLADVRNEMKVAQEEVFGPVLAVLRFSTEDEVVAMANDVPYGLAATVWTSDGARGHRLAQRIRSGTVGVNTPFVAFPGLPFGGFKQSGFGRDQGLQTLHEYTETKTVLWNTRERPALPWKL